MVAPPFGGVLAPSSSVLRRTMLIGMVFQFWRARGWIGRERHRYCCVVWQTRHRYGQKKACGLIGWSLMPACYSLRLVPLPLQSCRMPGPSEVYLPRPRHNSSSFRQMLDARAYGLWCFDRQTITARENCRGHRRVGTYCMLTLGRE